MTGMLLIYGAIYIQIHRQGPFRIVEGMTIEEVSGIAGVPEETYESDEIIPRWGNVGATRASRRSIVYHPFPASVYRVVVELDNGRVFHIGRQLN